MERWKKTGQAITQATDWPIHGKWRRLANRMVRAQLKTELVRELKKSPELGNDSRQKSLSPTSSRLDEPSES